MNKLRKIKNWPLILLALIVLFGFWLRFQQLDHLELFGDEIDVGYQAYSLLKTGHDYKGNFLPLYLQSMIEWRAPLLMYVTAPFLALFGLNEWGVRMPDVLFGTLSLIILYLLVNSLTKNKKLALFSTLILAISPWHLQYSRAAFEVVLMLFFILAGCLTFWWAEKKNSLPLALLTGLLFALPLYAYNTANIFVPLLIAALFFLYPNRSKSKKLRIVLGLTFLVLVLPLVSQIFFGHAAERYGTLSVLTNSELIDKIHLFRNYPEINPSVERFFHNKPLTWTKKIAENYVSAFAPHFLVIHGDVTFRHSLHEIGQIFWWQIPFLLLGLYYLCRHWQKWEHRLWVIWLLIAPLPASLTIDGGYHATRLIFMVVPLTVITAYGITAWPTFSQQFKKRFSLIKNLIILAILFLALFEFLNHQHYYYQHYRYDSWRWWHCGYKEAFQALDQVDNDYQRVLIENTYEPALIRYLFWQGYDPRLIIPLDDRSQEKAIDDFSGFCLDEKTCFVNFGSLIEEGDLKKDQLYLISQERNVPGADWANNPPSWVRIIKTINNPWGQPIFYLLTANSS